MRLVTSTVNPGAASRRSPTAELPSTSCSRLSSTSNMWRSARCRRRPLARSRPGASRTLSTSAIAEITSVGSVSGSGPRSTRRRGTGRAASKRSRARAGSSRRHRVGEREQSRLTQESLDVAHRPCSADERGSSRTHVCPVGPPRPQRREVGAQAIDHEVVQSLRMLEAFQVVQPDLGTSRRRARRPQRGRGWPPISRFGHRGLPPRSEPPGRRRSRRSCRRPERPRRCAVPCGPGSGCRRARDAQRALVAPRRRLAARPTPSGTRRRTSRPRCRSRHLPARRPRCARSRCVGPSWRTNPSRPSSCSTRVDPSMSVNRNVTVPVGRSRILRTVRERPGRSLPAIGPRTTNLRGALMRGASTSDGPLARRKRESDQATRDH